MLSPIVRIVKPQTPEQPASVRGTFQECAQQLSVDPSFQDFDAELDDLPGEYAEPKGALLLAMVDGKLAGCCALRRLVSSDYLNACEMKRLFVRNNHRRLGLGRQLAEAIIDAARVAGYHHLLLDTLTEMESAKALYEDLSFEEIPPYYHNPIAGAHYLKVCL